MRRDPVATRKKLLVAARREFAQSGLAGARVDEIAARAGVNKQLVYHYFGDKDALRSVKIPRARVQENDGALDLQEDDAGAL